MVLIFVVKVLKPKGQLRQLAPVAARLFRGHLSSKPSAYLQRLRFRVPLRALVGGGLRGPS